MSHTAVESYCVICKGDYGIGITATMVRIRHTTHAFWMARPGRRPKPRDPKAMRELERSATSYRRRLDKLEADHDRLRTERDDAIRRAHPAGLPLSDMADAFNLSRQRVSKIVGRK